MNKDEAIQLSHKEFLAIDRDAEKAAKAVDLVYVSDAQPGITRLRKGIGFSYVFKGKPIRGKKMIDRFRKLVIPPAWRNVWICPLPNGHLQATGIDVMGRKQYRYHALWNALRNETKFHRLLEFGKALPQIRLQVEKDLCAHELNERKVLATVVSLMERTYIRVGNESYEKLYGSYGLTTMKDAHVSIKGTEIHFSFKGKKGVYHDISIRSRKLSGIVKACRDIPGKELFQYYDEGGNKHSIDSGSVNTYIKEISGQEFTAKDFRTWSGSVSLLQSLKSIGQATTVADCKKNIVTALDEVATKLGNTRAICKKYYVHPELMRLYEESSLQKYFDELDKLEECDNPSGHTRDEKILMKILKDAH